MRCGSGTERAQAVADGDRRHAVRAGQGRGGQRVGDVVRGDRRGVALQVGQRGQLGGRRAPLLDERAVGQHVVDDADHATGRGRRG